MSTRRWIPPSTWEAIIYQYWWCFNGPLVEVFSIPWEFFWRKFCVRTLYLSFWLLLMILLRLWLLYLWRQRQFRKLLVQLSIAWVTHINNLVAIVNLESFLWYFGDFDFRVVILVGLVGFDYIFAQLIHWIYYKTKWIPELKNKRFEQNKHPKQPKYSLLKANRSR